MLPPDICFKSVSYTHLIGVDLNQYSTLFPAQFFNFLPEELLTFTVTALSYHRAPGRIKDRTSN